MPVCPMCYEDAPLCQKASNPALVCSYVPQDFLGSRLPSGAYEPSLRNSLPNQAQDVEGPHLDTLLGFTSPTTVAETLTADETTMQGAVAGTLVVDNLNVAVSLARKRPALRQQIQDSIDAIAMTANQLGVTRCQYAMTQIRSQMELQMKEKEKAQPSTALGYKQVAYPRATLFNTIGRSVAKGMEVQVDAQKMFDSDTGKTLVPLKSLPKITTAADLVYAVSLYCTSMQTLKQEASRVYFELMRDVTRVANDKGPKFGVEYVDCLLRYLDEGRFANMVALYKSGEPTRVYMELSTRAPSLVPKDPARFVKKVINNFGPVTKPMGGKGAGVIQQKCNRFHADPMRACTAGVPSDEGFPDWQVGLCAYEH